MAHARGGGVATLVVERRPAGEGSVGLDAEGRVVRLRRDCFGDEAGGGEFLGVHVLGESLRRLLPARGGLIEDVFVPAMGRGATLRAFAYEGPWHDIGTLGAYLAANAAWLAARGLSSWRGPGARVSPGVRLDHSVVGGGAQIDGEGVLAGCVVWPEARTSAPRAGEVVTS
jgi:mannose-1-phosphate guanylyltransferase